jgi:hypothetical protein
LTASVTEVANAAINSTPSSLSRAPAARFDSCQIALGISYNEFNSLTFL